MNAELSHGARLTASFGKKIDLWPGPNKSVLLPKVCISPPGFADSKCGAFFELIPPAGRKDSPTHFLINPGDLSFFY